MPPPVWQDDMSFWMEKIDTKSDHVLEVVEEIFHLTSKIFTMTSKKRASGMPMSLPGAGLQRNKSVLLERALTGTRTAMETAIGASGAGNFPTEPTVSDDSARLGRVQWRNSQSNPSLTESESLNGPNGGKRNSTNSVENTDRASLHELSQVIEFEDDHESSYTPPPPHSSGMVNSASALMTKFTSLRRWSGTCTYNKSYKRHIWRTLEDGRSSRNAMIYQKVMVVLILTGIATVYIGVLWPDSSVVWLTLVLQAVYIIELVTRFMVCPNYARFVCNGWNIFDFFSIVFFVPSAILVSVGRNPNEFMQFYVFLPLVLLLKLLRRFKTFHLLVSAFNVALEALPILLYTLLVIVMSFSSLIFVVEPGVGGNQGFIDSLWFTLVTVSTVGYGDLAPKTGPGKLMSSFLIIIGVLYMAIPIGIVGGAFCKVWEDRERLLILEQMRDHVSNAGYTKTDLAIMFASLDVDGDCCLSLDEFKKVIPMMHIEMSVDAVVQVFDTFDEDGEGTIDFQEFLLGIYPTLNFFSRKSYHKKKKLLRIESLTSF